MKYLVGLLIILSGCGGGGGDEGNSYEKDSADVAVLIHRGDSIYSLKASYPGFVKSLELYDSAMRIAEKNRDTLLLAKAVFAKGRAYDALNSNPQKTIDSYKEAASLYATLPGQSDKALYIKHLVAHSYDKISDSTDCVKILRELYREIYPKPDSIKKKLRFTAEMALISTVVKNYGLADSILRHLTKREWIANDSTEYDYLNHYYLSMSRLEVFEKGNRNSTYLDSLETVFNNSKNFSDSGFFSNALMILYKKSGDSIKGMKYERVNFQLNENLNDPNIIPKMKAKLAEMETASIESKRKEADGLAQNRTMMAYMLGALLLATIIFVFFLARKNMEISERRKELQQSNDQLYEKDLQNELLNKEIHHRVKNNLQMILSLVYMQERTTQTEEAKNNLQDIRFRIESVAALHDQLVEHNNEIVDLKQYVTKLVNAVASLAGNNRHIFTHLEIDPVTIPVKQSFPLGQLLNEWITNTIKHAGTNNESLAIYISVKKENDAVKVQYSDSGRPVNKADVTDQLGMSIIDLLVTQLNGKLQRADENHFTYSLTFNCDGE